MGVFKMTLEFCHQYEKLICDFWWGDEEDNHKYTGWHGKI
jgi:hypothetical protein